MSFLIIVLFCSIREANKCVPKNFEQFQTSNFNKNCNIFRNFLIFLWKYCLIASHRDFISEKKAISCELVSKLYWCIILIFADSNFSGLGFCYFSIICAASVFSLTPNKCVYKNLILKVFSYFKFSLNILPSVNFTAQYLTLRVWISDSPKFQGCLYFWGVYISGVSEDTNQTPKFHTPLSI